MPQEQAKSIFIVDDDELFTTMLSNYLSKNPLYQIQSFSTGEDALARLNDHPDIIILDYSLNSVFKDAANGLQVLEAIRKLDKHVHVIMLSSQERYGIAVQTIAKGAEQYVVKSTEAFKEVSDIIRQLN